MPEKSRLKILHVLLSRGFAGSERSTSESCNQQCHDNDVFLVVRKGHRKRGRSIVDHIDARVHVIEIGSRFFVGASLKKCIAELAPDIIHCHLRRSTRLVAKISPIVPAVSTLHIKVNGPHFLQMSGLICNARWQVGSIPNTYRGKVFKAANSLVAHRRLASEEVDLLRNRLNILPDQIFVGAVGRYHPSKGWDTLINAFKAVDAPKAQLLFFGAGSQESELRGLAETDKRIRFIGYCDDIKDVYQCMDLLVCPSRFEPLPRVMLEAMDAGVPLIASDEGGCKELIDDYGGQLFPVDNVAALRECLQCSLQNVPARHYPDLSAHYVENANAAMLEFYRSLIADRVKV